MFERGTRLGDRYHLLERIGAGGMAEVWRAEDTRLRRDVAVKVLRERDDELARRLRRESRVLAGLNHRGIVAVLDAGDVEGRPFVVLELVSGMTLAEVLRRDGRLTPERAATLGGELADALAHAHALGVVHRDVKPSNILLTDDGRTCLVDFGIARTADATRLTGTGLSIGTAAYLAPEQMDAPDRVGPPADVYALALVLAEALSGRRVFPGPAAAAALARLRTDPPLADLPAGWSVLLHDMTRRDPSERPDAAAVARAVPSVDGAGARVAGGAAGAPASADAVATQRDVAPATAPTTATMPAAAVGVGAGVAVASAGAVPLDAPGATAAGRGVDRRRLWLVTAAVLAFLGVGLAVGLTAGGGDEPPEVSPTASVTPVAPVGDTVPTTTTVPPTTPTTLVPTTVAPTTVIPTTDPGPPDGRKPPKPPKPNDDRGDRGDRGDRDDDD